MTHTTFRIIGAALCLAQLGTLQGCFFNDDVLGDTLREDEADTGSVSPLDMSNPPDQTVTRPDLARDPVDLGQDLNAPDMPDEGPPRACTEYTNVDDGVLCGLKEECEASCVERCSGTTCNMATAIFDEENCQAECATGTQVICVDEDGLCPEGCTFADDNDCRSPFVVDLCQEPVFTEDLGGKAIVFDEVRTSNLCCQDFNGDGILDNAWMRDFLSGGTASYNAYLDAAYEKGLVHIVLEFGELEQSATLSEARELRQYIGEPQCFSRIDQSQIRVYRPDASSPSIRFDTVSVGKSLPPRLTATSREMLVPMYGVEEDIFYTKMRGVSMSATVSDDGQALFNGELSGHITPYDYFSAVNAYYDEACPCFGESMFDLDANTQTYSCNALSSNTCQGSACESSVGICPGMINKFRISADIDSDDPNGPCEPFDTANPTCDAISIGLKFDTRSAYLINR